ncbi:1-(5-phosphoribosyl)-5-[(5-phosphoribosylamino)methylideneamino]imidazole-4-carboxamide isomerase [Prolixibacteraceae bacterium JC049]|nr:1-(5-phosphoribosyl)-5-[(5-phosphoribosylamino)methylideneamino]imidazole-4-carboxamide isomerase [Prolixibacteraceae bacterium JC049]
MITIIPAIDIIEGKCVRLNQGDYAQKKVYNENPLEVAKIFQDAGIERLHLVDLDGAKSHHVVNHKVLERIAGHTNLVIDFGGGIKSDEDLHIAFESGAEMVTGGSIAVKEPDVFSGWLSKYGSEKIILGADAKDGKIAIAGWQEESDLEIVDFINNYVTKGAQKVISTDIAKDGMLTGPSFDLYELLQEKCEGIELIASGGISNMDDIYKLDEMAIPGVIVGKAIYEGRIDMKDISRFILNQ